MADDPPWFREVKENPIDVLFLDSLIDIADLDTVARVLTKQIPNICLGPLREILADLISDDRTSRSKRDQRQCTAPHTGLEYSSAGKQIGRHENRSEIFRIDDLGAPRHLENQITERGSEHEKMTRRAAAIISLVSKNLKTFWLPDDLVMVDHSRVGREHTMFNKADEIASILAVDQKDTLSLRQPSPRMGPFLFYIHSFRCSFERRRLCLVVPATLEITIV